MGVRILHNQREAIAALYCSTNGWAFGPIFEGPDADLDAEAFIGWFTSGGAVRAAARAEIIHRGDGSDPRQYDQGDLEVLHTDWSNAREGAAA